MQFARSDSKGKEEKMIKVDAKTHTAIVHGSMETIFCEAVQILKCCMAAAKQTYGSDAAADAIVDYICKTARENKIPADSNNLHIYQYKGKDDDFEEFLKKKYGA